MLRQQLTAVALLVLLAPTCLQAQSTSDPAADWRGVKVLPKLDAVVKAGDTVLEDEQTPGLKPLYLPWVVQDVDGDWLCVGDSHKGWVQRTDVVTLDQATQYYTELINRGEQPAWAYNLRATAWQHKGDLDRAIADFDEYLRLNADAIAYNNRGTVWSDKKQYDKAIADYNQAIRLAPSDALVYNNRGAAWLGKKEHDKAIADYNQAIRLDPGDALAYTGRGRAWRNKKEYDKAIADYNRAIRLDPNNAPAHNNIAWLRATCPDARYRDGKLAVTMATRACELAGWTNDSWIGTLAAAYAEAKDFDSAIKWLEKASEMNSSDSQLATLRKEMLALYRQKKPYRE